MKKVLHILAAFLLFTVTAQAQVDRKDVRAGNRQFRKENYKEADISYRKALVKDSLSVAGNYNLASVLYRQEQYDEAGKTMDRLKDIAPGHPQGADCYFNAGDIALARKDYGAAVEAFMKSLILNPDDLQAKENYIYAKKMLQDQQQNGGGQGGRDDQSGGDNENDGQGNDDNQDQSGNDNQDNNDNQDGNDGNNDRNQDDSRQGQAQEQTVNISPQQAQQMLKAIQAKEKATQEKVNREKAENLKSRQKEKNW